jgi:hypothetical protein
MSEQSDRRRRTRPHDITNDEWLWALPRGVLAALVVMAIVVLVMLLGPSS